MAETKIPVFCLRSSSMLHLGLDLLAVQSVEEILEKARGFIPDFVPAKLLYVYSDDLTPTTHLRVLDELDLRAVQEDALMRQCESAYFRYESEEPAEPLRAIQFFKKTVQAQEPVGVQPSQSSAFPLLELVRLPFSIALNKDETSVSLQKRDFTILEESSAFEPEYVPSGSCLTRKWRLLVSGEPWEQAAAVYLRDNSVRKGLIITQASSTLSLDLQVEVGAEDCSLAFRLALDGEMCGPVLWVEAGVEREVSLEQQLLDLGAYEDELEGLKQLYEIGLTDLPKLMKAWKRRYGGMDAVANLYWGEEAE